MLNLQKLGNGKPIMVALFIDEIANISLNIQAKLLRVLQDFKISRVEYKFIDLNLRVIVASNKNLWEEVRKGNLGRRYYRLLGLTIVLPPLIERINDIPRLSQYFIQNYCKRNNIKIKNYSRCLDKLFMNFYK